MSFAMAREGVQDFLRDELSWDKTQCGVVFDALPHPKSKQWYVAIDVNAMEPGPSNSAYLKEEQTVDIGIWRRVSERPIDYLYNLLFRTDKYQATIKTIEQLEREVMTVLHFKPDVRNFINTQFSLPSDALGDVFTSPLTYLGKEDDRIVTPPESSIQFIGHRLRFKGLMRLQRISNMG
jgi:hypothetical protein